jgi:cytochrome c oxidase assembly protein subunit 15
MRDASGAQDRESAGRHRAARFATGFALLLVVAVSLIVLGALVRAHGAGLACPDWPLCFGDLIPAFDFHVAFEVGHRYLAGTVSLLFLGLAFGVARDASLRRAMGRPLLVAVLLLATQVVLGGLTVLHLLASWTVTAHLVTGNAFALTLLWITLRLREEAAGPQPAAEPISPVLRGVIAAGAALLAFQIVLGGLVSSRYAGLACPDWPTCSGGVFFPTFEGGVGLQLVHRLNAYGVATALALAALLARDVAGLATLTRLSVGLVLLQIGLGVANVLLKLPVEITALHSATAATLVLLQTASVRSAWHRPLRSHASPASQEAAGARG